MVFIFTHGRPLGLACKAQAEEYGVKTPSFQLKKKPRHHHPPNLMPTIYKKINILIYSEHGMDECGSM